MEIDILAVLDELDGIIRKAKGVPLSSSAVIPREEVLDRLAKVREAFPKQTEQAKEVLAGRDSVLADARAEAERILEDARQERTRMLSRSDLIQHAQAEAKRLVDEADEESSKLKVQTDDWVDAKLAAFEILLNRTLKTVGRGREQLRQRLEAAQDLVAPLNLDDSGEISGEIAQI